MFEGGSTIEKFFSLNINDLTIRGMSHFSGDKLIIYIPGMNSVRSDVHRIGLKLYKESISNSISIISFDYRGLGISDGFFEDATFETKLEDSEKVLHYAFENGFDCKNIYFLGFSDGAIISLYLSHKYSTNVIFWSPLIINEDDNNSNISISRNVFNSLVAEDYGLAFTTQYFYNKKNMINKLQNLDVKTNDTLIIYGSNDFTVNKSLEFVKKIFVNSKIKSVPNGDHIFSSPKRESFAINTTIDWVLRSDMHAK